MTKKKNNLNNVPSIEKVRLRHDRLTRRVYIVLAALAILILSFMLYNFYATHKAVRRHHLQLTTAMNARTSIINSQLFFEKAILTQKTEQKKEYIQAIESNLNDAQQHLNLLVNGGNDQKFKYLPLKNESLRSRINNSIEAVNKMLPLAQNIQLYPTSEDIDIEQMSQQYEVLKNQALNELSGLEYQLQTYIANQWNQFKTAKVFLVSACVISFIMASATFHRLINRQMDDEISTIKLSQQLEAGNQQLKASQQQLQASQQQLKAANQQLEAGNQQLTAANRELVNSEKKRNELIRLLESRNEELQNVVYIASHDLRSPLVNIKGFSAELNRACKELQNTLRLVPSAHPEIEKINHLIKEEMPESLKFISSSANSMEMLISGLLKVSRIGTAPINIQKVKTDKIVADAVSSLEYEIKDKDIKIEVQKELPDCIADHGQLHQVFSNLLSNAIKYLHPDRPGRINVTGEKENGYAIYCIEDNGIGIDEEHQCQIFNIFHRLNPAGPVSGDGLGLTIVKRIIDRNSGEIWLESQPEKGSKFLFKMPSPA